MIPIISVLLFLTMGMISGCASEIKCRDVCVPDQPCERLCRPKEWWNDYGKAIMLRKGKIARPTIENRCNIYIGEKKFKWYRNTELVVKKEYEDQNMVR